MTVLQRLFSTFPNAWPGAGILVLRLTAAIGLLVGGVPELRGLPYPALFAARVIAVSTGILPFVGLWTPFAGALQAIIELWDAASRGSTAGIHLLLAVVGVSLVMLGPGAWSIDARLFGRKRIDIPSRNSPPHARAGSTDR